MNKELEEAKEILDKFANGEMQRDKLERDNRCGGWKIGDIYKKTELNPAIFTVLQALDNSIPKEKVIEGIERIEDYFDRLNGPEEDIDFIREIKQELLEGK